MGNSMLVIDTLLTALLVRLNGVGPKSFCISFTFFSFNIEAAELLQNLSLDSQPKTLEIPEPTKKVIKYLF